MITGNGLVQPYGTSAFVKSKMHAMAFEGSAARAHAAMVDNTTRPAANAGWQMQRDADQHRANMNLNAQVNRDLKANNLAQFEGRSPLVSVYDQVFQEFPNDPWLLGQRATTPNSYQATIIDDTAQRLAGQPWKLALRAESINSELSREKKFQVNPNAKFTE